LPQITAQAFALLHNATPQATVMLGIQAQELLILEVQPAINFISESVTEFQQDETVFIVGHEFS
jgi:hypothetical protein